MAVAIYTISSFATAANASPQKVCYRNQNICPSFANNLISNSLTSIRVAVAPTYITILPCRKTISDSVERARRNGSNVSAVPASFHSMRISFLPFLFFSILMKTFGLNAFGFLTFGFAEGARCQKRKWNRNETGRMKLLISTLWRMPLWQQAVWAHEAAYSSNEMDHRPPRRSLLLLHTTLTTELCALWMGIPFALLKAFIEAFEFRSINHDKRRVPVIRPESRSFSRRQRPTLISLRLCRLMDFSISKCLNKWFCAENYCWLWTWNAC